MQLQTSYTIFKTIKKKIFYFPSFSMLLFQSLCDFFRLIFETLIAIFRSIALISYMWPPTFRSTSSFFYYFFLNKWKIKCRRYVAPRFFIWKWIFFKSRPNALKFKNISRSKTWNRHRNVQNQFISIKRNSNPQQS